MNSTRQRPLMLIWGILIACAIAIPWFVLCPFSPLWRFLIPVILCSLYLLVRSRKAVSFRNSAFTLVELLTVIAILSVLAGLLLPSLSKAREKAKETATKTFIQQIEIALGMYEEDHGILPPDYDADAAHAHGSDAESLYYYLVEDLPGTSKDEYLDLRDKQICDKDTGTGSGSGRNELRDNFGNPIQYDWNAGASEPGLGHANQRNSFDLWSFGSDGIDDDGDGNDINNWD